MRKFFASVCLTIAMTLFFLSALWYYAPTLHASKIALSPIPDFLMVSENSQVRLLDLWSPIVQSIHGSSGDMAELTSKSALMYDLTDNKLLYEKDPKERLPMASLTKIMTAIISMENRLPSDRYIVHGEDLVGEDSMGLTAGEVLSMEELLYGLMLPSGNDAAEVLAANYPQGRNAFVLAMNNKAKALGLKDTQFSNPSGLQGDGVQYTTSYDLLVMTRYALEHYPLFVQVVATPEYEIPATTEHGGYFLKNETNLLTTYEGVKGVKTGYTPEAGLCLVTYITYGGHDIVGIVLNSEDRRGEMLRLLDYSLKSIGVTPPPYTGDNLTQ